MKINIGFGFKPEIDFGMIRGKYRLGTIKVEKEQWEEYIRLRYLWEVAHDKLFRKMPRKKCKEFHNLKMELKV